MGAMGNIRLGLALLFLVCATLSLQVSAGAKEAVESLLRPGDLSKAHARYEKECDKCHENFKANRQNKLCLKCHKDINENITKKTGSHGRIKDIKDRECRTCHSEHKGRDRNLSAFDQESFDHAQTDFALKGWHLQVECSQCHKPNSKFSEAPKDCIACHRNDDRHKTRLGELCKNCHIEAAWKTARFDHDKTNFKLKERHKDAVCADCHPNERYANTPANCFFCHEMDDTHGGNHGKKCDACHAESGWFRVKFNHDKDTKFELKDMHGKLACKDCHGGNVYEKRLKADCFSCHEASDKHNGQYGKDCEEMISEIYPEELVHAVPNPTEDRAAAVRWFANHTGTGVAAANRMASLYSVITEVDASKQPDGENKAPSKKTTSPRTALRQPPRKVQSEARTPDQVETGRNAEVKNNVGQSEGPDLNINVQIHISADASTDQIEQIFASMAKHIYRRT